MRITTSYVTAANGAGKILAKGEGKQRTVPFDHSLSVARNHGVAAGTLALVLVQGDTARAVAAKTATHTVNNKGQHVFTLG